MGTYTGWVGRIIEREAFKLHVGGGSAHCHVMLLLFHVVVVVECSLHGGVHCAPIDQHHTVDVDL